MDTIEKRDFHITLMVEKDDIIKFIEQMDPKEFVRIHQDNFKDYYLSQPPIQIDNELFDDWCLWHTFQEKYTEFFVEKGLDESIKWISDDYCTMEMLKAELEGTDDEELMEKAYDYFHDLYFDMWSSWAISWFIYEIVNLYQESKIDEEVLEFN